MADRTEEIHTVIPAQLDRLRASLHGSAPINAGVLYERGR
jgi:hypothetical protein